MLIVIAICWRIWKHINDICFNAVTLKNPRQIILLILSLISYWLGRVSPQIQEETTLWLPTNTNEIPICVWHPDDEFQMVVYEGDTYLANAGHLDEEFQLVVYEGDTILANV